VNSQERPMTINERIVSLPIIGWLFYIFFRMVGIKVERKKPNHPVF